MVEAEPGETTGRVPLDVEDDRPLVPHGRLLLGLAADATLDESCSQTVVSGAWGRVRLEQPPAAASEALRRMALGPVALENVEQLRQAHADWTAGTGGQCSPWLQVKETLNALGGYVMPALALHDGLSPVLTLPAVTAEAPWQAHQVDATTQVEPVDGAQLLASGEGGTVTAPRAARRAVVHRWPARDVIEALLIGPGTPAGAAAASRVSVGLVQDIVSLLVAAKLLQRCSGPCRSRR